MQVELLDKMYVCTYSMLCCNTLRIFGINSKIIHNSLLSNNETMLE